MREITEIFDSKPDVQQHEFMQDFGSVLKPDQMARQLGFFKHPLYVNAVEDGLRFGAKRQLASVFLYSLDIESQHAFLKINKKKREQKAGKTKRAVEQWRKSKVPAVAFGSESIEQAALADHLITFLESQPSSVMLSVPDSQSVAMKNLQAALAPPSSNVQGNQPLQSELEPEPSRAVDDSIVVAAPVPPRLMFFRLVKVPMHRQKLVALPAAHARKLSKHDWCVTLHDGQSRLEADEETHLVSVEATSASAAQNSVAVLSLLKSDLATMRNEMKVWLTRKAPRYIVSGVEHPALRDAEVALQTLVASRAFGRSETVLEVVASDVAMLEQLNILLQCRVVEQIESNRNVSKWRFTSFGAAKLRAANELVQPEPVFQALTDTSLEALEAGTCWQLFAALRSQGFHVRQRPSSKEAVRRLPPHTPDSVNRLWYVSGSSLQHLRKYMITLIYSEKLFGEGVLQRVHHCQPVGYYTEVLQGLHTGSPLLALPDGREEVAPLQLDAENAPLLLDGRVVPAPLELPAPAVMPPKKRVKRIHDRQDRAGQEPGLGLEPGPVDPALGGAVRVEQGDNSNNDDDDDVVSSGLSSEAQSSQILFLSDAEQSDGAFEGLMNDEYVHSPPSPPSDLHLHNDAVEVDRGPQPGQRASQSDAEPADLPPHRPVEEPAEPAESAPAAPVPAPALASDVDGARAVRGRHRDMESFVWGPFRITWSRPDQRPPHGSWQATCPFHALNSRTGCKKAIGLRDSTDTEKAKCRDLLKLWCLQAPTHDRQRRHNRTQPRQLELLDAAVLEARLQALPDPPARDVLEDDATLDARAPAPKAKGKAKSKGKAKAGAKAAAAKAAAAAAHEEPEPRSPSQVAASDPDSSDSGDSQESSSSSSRSSSSSGSSSS